MTGTPLPNSGSMQLSYKAYTDATITPGVEPTPSVDPGASGAQILRRVTSSLNFKKDTFSSNEITVHRQMPDFRHGGVSVAGDLTGELSPHTYQDLMAGVLGATWGNGTVVGNGTLGNLTAFAGNSTIQCDVSTFAAAGLFSGDVFRLTNTDGTHNGVNFTITQLNGNVATCYPPPGNMSSDPSWTLTVPGKKVFPAVSGLTEHKFAFEHYYTDVALAHLFTECRVGLMKLSMPTKGIPTVSFGVIGRDLFLPGSPPFFTSPSAVTTTAELTTFGGHLLLGGVSQAIIVSADVTIDHKLKDEAVAFVPENAGIFTGVLDCKISLKAFFYDNTLLNDFINETIFDLHLMMTTANSATADFISIYFGRVKFSANDVSNSGFSAIPVTLTAQAYLDPSATGRNNTSVTIIDSLAV